MTEPTDSETMESLDRFAEAMLKIDEESKSDPEKVRNAPIPRRFDGWMKLPPIELLT